MPTTCVDLQRREKGRKDLERFRFCEMSDLVFLERDACCGTKRQDSVSAAFVLNIDFFSNLTEVTQHVSKIQSTCGG